MVRPGRGQPSTTLRKGPGPFRRVGVGAGARGRIARMSWYELLLTLHILAAGLYFGSVIAITVLGHRALASDPPSFGPVLSHAGWWASKAHPAAATVILIAGILMVIDADLSFGDAWISLGLAG